MCSVILFALYFYYLSFVFHKHLNKIQVKIIKPCAMQIDGEPWYQHPCEFNIRYCNKAVMLVNTIERTI